MLEVYTEAEFAKLLSWAEIDLGYDCQRNHALVDLADHMGRIAISDNFELEKIWDRFVQAYDELMDWRHWEKQ